MVKHIPMLPFSVCCAIIMIIIRKSCVYMYSGKLKHLSSPPDRGTIYLTQQWYMEFKSPDYKTHNMEKIVLIFTIFTSVLKTYDN